MILQKKNDTEQILHKNGLRKSSKQLELSLLLKQVFSGNKFYAF